MFKATLISLMALLVSLGVHSKSFVQSYENYVHLSDLEKDQMIIKTMELVVELESKYNYEVRKYGYSQERFEKFVKAIQKIKSALFIDSAYAQDSLNKWQEYGNTFTKLVDNKKGDCLFAGWVSTSYSANKKTYCAHPGFNPKNQDVKKAYPKEKADPKCGANNPKMIQCNPAIFGFKKEEDQSLFCVEAANGAHNSSYHCMNAALNVEEKDPKVDSKEKRLKFLRENLAQNPKIFENVQKFVYKTCVCEEPPLDFNSNYHKYMRPHRTCYGLMGMMAETVVCESPELPIDTTIFESLQSFTQEKLLSLNSEKLIDEHYGNFIKNDVKNRAPDEYNRLCGGNLPVPPTPAPTPTPEVGKKDPFTCSMAKCDVPGEGSKCVFTISEEGKTDPVTLSDEIYDVPEKGASEVKVSGKVGDKEVNLTCPLENNQSSEKYLCQKATCAPVSSKTAGAEESGATHYECSFSVIDQESGEAVELTNPKYGEEPVTNDVTSIPVTGLIGEEEVPLSCPVELKEMEEKNEDDVMPTLSVKISDKGEKFYTVDAEVTNGEGWTFSWSIKNPGKEKISQGWKKKKTVKKETVLKGLATDDEEEVEAEEAEKTEEELKAEAALKAQEEAKAEAVEEAQEEEEEEVVAPELAGDDRQTIQERYSFDYEVCGQLSRGSQKVPETPSCVTIDKLKAVKAPASPMPQQPPGGPPMQIRHSGDTSAIGIK